MKLNEGSNELSISLELIEAPPVVTSLWGKVTDKSTGNPLQHVTVTVSGKTDVTDALGRYSITGLMPGEQEVKFEKSGYVTVIK